MLDGLYIGTDSLTGDYATVLQRIQLLGFNAVRLPFSFQVAPFISPWSGGVCSTEYPRCCSRR